MGKTIRKFQGTTKRDGQFTQTRKEWKDLSKHGNFASKRKKLDRMKDKEIRRELQQIRNFR